MQASCKKKQKMAVWFCFPDSRLKEQALGFVLQPRQLVLFVVLKAHWETLAAIDFTNVEVWAPRGLVTMSCCL